MFLWDGIDVVGMCARVLMDMNGKDEVIPMAKIGLHLFDHGGVEAKGQVSTVGPNLTPASMPL